MIKGQINTGMVFPDMHIPDYDPAVVAIPLEYMSRMGGVDFFVQVGDLMNLDCISSHNKNNLREIEGKQLQQDYDCGNRITDKIQEAVGPRGEGDIYFIQGNHDERAERLVDANPRLTGLVEPEINLHLRERGIKWVPYWRTGEIVTIGKANFIHGRYIIEHHAKKHVQAYGVNIFYGHTHSCQKHSMVRYGDNHAIVGESLGWMGRSPTYMQGAPTNWQHAFATFETWPNGNFNHTVHTVVGGKCVIGGELYDGNKLRKEWGI